MHELFRKMSSAVSQAVSSFWASLFAVAAVLTWALTGAWFHYSDTWQLVMNTTSAVVTFIMVFLIQNSQSRDTKAIQLKLDELLRGVQGARTGLVNLESLSDEELAQLQREFEKLAIKPLKDDPK